MSRGVFVTGTDTGVGKTVAACALVRALRSAGQRVAPMKPVAAGASEREGRWLNEDTFALMQAAGYPPEAAQDVTPVLLREPMAPHIAARREGCAIDVRRILDAFHASGASGAFQVVEGVGGFRVPLAPGFDTADMARDFALPVVLVVGLRLGCLNHASLTAEAIRVRGLALAGWIANTVDPAMAVADENIETLRELIAAPLLGRLPWRSPPDPAQLARHLDVAPLLEAR